MLLDVFKSSGSLVGDRVRLDLLHVLRNRVDFRLFSSFFSVIDQHLILDVSRNTVEDFLFSWDLALSHGLILCTINEGHDIRKFDLQSILDKLGLINAFPHLLYLIGGKLCIRSLWRHLIIFQLGELYQKAIIEQVFSFLKYAK